MLQKPAVVMMVLFLYSVAYWGVVPKAKELVTVSHDIDKDVTAKSEVRIQSQSFGRILLDISINRESVSNTAKRHDVFPSHRKQHVMRTNCHYRGKIRGIPDSWAVLSYCSGTFRGSISQLLGEVWYLVQDNGSYVMFPDSSLPNPPEIATADYYGIELISTSPLPLSNHSVPSKRSSDHSLVIEIVVVTDQTLWQSLEADSVDVEEFVLSTVAHMDEIYKKVGFRMALVGVESWKAGDVIEVTSSYSTTLRKFTSYRQQSLLDIYKQHDISILMTGVDFDGPVIGYAGINNICRSGCSNVNFNSRNNPAYYAAVISHEVGHNLGMYHDNEDVEEDDNESCSCSNNEKQDTTTTSSSSDACIMSGIITGTPTLFSDCSKEFLRSDEMNNFCLRNQPDTLYGDPVCGNGFVEEGEECDCGREEECLSSDPCCEPVGCKLKVGAECYTGDCCQDCRFVSYKTACRPASSECDLGEFCTGTHSQCPTNRYRQDGAECWLGGGFCNYGSCMSRDTQCTSVWGEGVDVGSDLCFSHYNIRGDYFGNCGAIGGGMFITCKPEDVMCGKLFCSVPQDRSPQLPNVYGQTQTYQSPHTSQSLSCSMARASQWSDNKEVAMVYDGSKCGEGKWCMSGECVEFRRAGCPAPGGVECGGHGNCNDLNECHCHAGYDPLSNCAALLRVAALDTKKILIAVSVIVLLVIPLLIVGLLLLRRYNPRVKAVMDRKTHIRFSVRLPSMSRRGSSLRNTRPPKEGDKTKKIPPARPVKLPDSEQGPARPPGSYKTSSGWSTSSYNQTQPTSAQNQYTSYSDKPSTSSWDSSDEETHPFHPTSSQPGPSKPVPVRAAPARPVRPAPTFNEIPESQSDDTTNSLYIPQSTGISSSYSPLKMRPSPTRPPAISRDPATRSTEENARVKLDISGPESARKLINDSPLDDRRLAGSTLKDVQR